MVKLACVILEQSRQEYRLCYVRPTEKLSTHRHWIRLLLTFSKQSLKLKFLTVPNMEVRDIVYHHVPSMNSSKFKHKTNKIRNHPERLRVNQDVNIFVVSVVSFWLWLFSSTQNIKKQWSGQEAHSSAPCKMPGPMAARRESRELAQEARCSLLPEDTGWEWLTPTRPLSCPARV